MKDKIKYPNVNVGDKFECLKNIYFIDGTRHTKGVTYTVKPGETAYYSVNHRDYRKIIDK